MVVGFAAFVVVVVGVVVVVVVDLNPLKRTQAFFLVLKMSCEIFNCSLTTSLIKDFFLIV